MNSKALLFPYVLASSVPLFVISCKWKSEKYKFNKRGNSRPNDIMPLSAHVYYYLRFPHLWPEACPIRRVLRRLQGPLDWLFMHYFLRITLKKRKCPATNHADFAFTYYGCTHRHIQAFSDALGADELLNDHQGYTSSPNIPGTPVSPAPRVRKVSALSDFAPVNLRVKRSVHLRPILQYAILTGNLFVQAQKEGQTTRKAEWLVIPSAPVAFTGMTCGYCSSIFRLMISKCFIFLFIAAEFGFYVIIRQLVNTKEWVTACMPHCLCSGPKLTINSLRARSEGGFEKEASGREQLSSKSLSQRSFWHLSRIRNGKLPQWYSMSICTFTNGKKWKKMPFMTGGWWRR